MIRKASVSEISILQRIRGAVRENKLSDPSRVTVEDYRWFIENPGVFVAEIDGRIVGFAAGDPRDGRIWALFMDRQYEGRGIARDLFAQACRSLKDAGWGRMSLTTRAGTRAEKFYRAAGWRVTGLEDCQLVFSSDPLEEPASRA